MTRASTPTILPLDEFAKQAGINPLYFSGAAPATVLGTMQIQHDQRPIWPQYEWQVQGQYSRETLARHIQKAELDIAHLIGYHPAPVYTVDEVHPYVSAAFRLNWNKVLTGGKRAVELLDTPTVTYTMEGSIPRWAEISFDTDADICEIGVFFENHNGERQWQIRPIESITRAGNTVTARMAAWQLIDPAQQERLPHTDDQIAIVADQMANYVTQVEVYRVYTDHQATAVEFHWRCTKCGNGSCAKCEPHVQAGCLHLVDPDLALVSAYPVDCACPSYKSAWFDVGRKPDYMKISYLSGAQENLYLEGAQCGQLGYDMAWLITILAASRIDYFFGANNNVQAFVDEWRRDITRPTDQGAQFVAVSLAENPLGTRNGEVTVYRALSKLRERVYGIGAI